MNDEKFRSIEAFFRRAFREREAPSGSEAFERNVMRDIRRSAFEAAEEDIGTILFRFASFSAAFALVVLMVGVSFNGDPLEGGIDLDSLDSLGPEPDSSISLFLGENA